jgi:hypothetical protein
MIRSVWKYALGLLTAAVVGLSGSAQATFSISISSSSFMTHNDSTGGNTLANTGNPNQITFTATNPANQGAFTGRYNLVATDTANLAQISTAGTGLGITNLSGSAITVTVVVTKDDFVLGPSIGSFFANLSVTSAAGSGNTFSYSASVGPNRSSETR